MSRFHSLYTQIQIRGPHEPPLPVPGRDRHGFLKPRFSAWVGWAGDPQIGPSYLGWWGIVSLVTGTLSFMIMGFNFWAQADWNTVEFIRGMAWHRLDPPTGPGLYLRDLNEGGWWQIAGTLLTISILCWWARMYTRAKALGLSTHVAWAFAAAIWLYLDHVPGRGVGAPALGERSEADQDATAGSLTVGVSVTRARLSSDMYRRATAHSSLVSSISAPTSRTMAREDADDV